MANRLHSAYARFVESTDVKPSVFALYVTLRLVVVLVLVRSLFAGRYDYALLCVLVMFLLHIPDLLKRHLSIELPSVLEGIILCFIFAAEILGEIGYFYVKIPFWDTMLHTLWGFLAAGIGFALVDLLNRSESSRLNLAPFYVATVAFCFSMTVGVLWELFEYAMDALVGFDMQKDTMVAQINTVLLDPTNTNTVVHVGDIASTQVTTAAGEVVLIPGGYLDVGIKDTMADLFVNLVGALAFSVLGFIYVKNRDNGKKGSFAANFIPRIKRTHNEER